MSPWSVGYSDSPLSQSIGAIPASRYSPVDVLMRIERSFCPLETHIEVPPTPVMVETMLEIMIEVLSILAIVTQEIKQGRTSESW